jgi:AmmeMemoRadiSam system protein A
VSSHGNPASDSTRADEDARLLELARRSIAHGLAHHGRAARLASIDLPASLRRPGACFVTLRSPAGELRGCVGSLAPDRALGEDVAENAVAAAFRDPRMPKVSAEELDELRIEISVLSPVEEIPARSLEDLVARLRPGRDGLVLADRGRRGTLLPQVWSRLANARDFAGAVWQKAGLPSDHWSASARAWRYTVRSIPET